MRILPDFRGGGSVLRLAAPRKRNSSRKYFRFLSAPTMMQIVPTRTMGVSRRQSRPTRATPRRTTPNPAMNSPGRSIGARVRRRRSRMGPIVCGPQASHRKPIPMRSTRIPAPIGMYSTRTIAPRCIWLASAEVNLRRGWALRTSQHRSMVRVQKRGAPLFL